MRTEQERELADACQQAIKAIESLKTLKKYLHGVTRRLAVGDVTSIKELNRLTIALQHAVSFYAPLRNGQQNDPYAK
jgi:hypothetical protein